VVGQVLWQGSALLLAFSLLSGCGSNNPLGRQAVSGKVNLGGKPLERGTISFEPLDQEGGVASGGLIENGRYEIPELKGLPPGSYRVRIFAGAPNPPGMGPDGQPAAPGADLPGRELIPPQYNVHSELTREITTGGNNQFDFDLPLP
jgi:hypothetical protein